MKRTILLGVLVACAGCTGPYDPAANCVRPTVAVMKFENRSGFPMQWDLGGGMKDVLVDRLMRSGRYRVIERPEIDSVVRELRFQHSGATRSQQRAALGRLKNVKYLIKGTITDFGHVANTTGFLNLDRLGLFHAGNLAVMGMTMYVVDVESGEVICSESLTESVRASNTKVQAAYQGIAFGGSLFYRTPLGKATGRVIDRAVRRVSQSIASRPWEPKIALVRADSVVINGGRDRRVRENLRYEVLERGEAITDPDTGDVLGYQAGRVVGTVAVEDVQPLYSVARITQGQSSQFRVGQHCRRTEALATR